MTTSAAPTHDHLSFGLGPRLYLGAPRARRLPDRRLAQRRSGRTPTIAFRGPTSLWVEV